jgi:hypothetical protein
VLFRSVHRIALSNYRPEPCQEDVIHPLKKVIRICSEADVKVVEGNCGDAAAFISCGRSRFLSQLPEAGTNAFDRPGGDRHALYVGFPPIKLAM